ncbi:hypothetical protein CYY_009754, partial [Polysphondylium violaceum]
VVAFVDDNVIFSNTLEEHYEHVKKVLDLFQMSVKRRSAIQNRGICWTYGIKRRYQTNLRQNKSHRGNIPMPTTVREVLCHVGQPRHRKRKLSSLKSNSAIKASITSADTLMAIDFSKRFNLYTDASDVGTGLMLTQRDKGGVETKWDQDFVTQVVESYEHHKKKEWLQALIRRDDVVKDNDGLLYLVDKAKRLILVDDKQLETILQEAHATTFCGHVGKNRLAARLKDLYFFKRFWTVIEKFIKACPECQKCRIETVKQGFLNPLPIPDRPWKTSRWTISNYQSPTKAKIIYS